MNIICLVKFTPDIENFIYDYEKNVLVREKTRMVINPDDACALAFALKLKTATPGVTVQVVTMAPLSIVPHVQDLIRRDVDSVVIISDKRFVGSDTYVTSKIIGKYLSNQAFDFILTGTHAIDGDTSHVPSQIGEMLNIDQISNIIKINELLLTEKSAVVEVDSDDSISKFEVEFPAILSLQKESKYKLPYVRYVDIDKDVSDRIEILDLEKIGCELSEVGLNGSLTKVSRTYVKKMSKMDRITVKNDEEGIQTVYDFLKEKGFV